MSCQGRYTLDDAWVAEDEQGTALTVLQTHDGNCWWTANKCPSSISQTTRSRSQGPVSNTVVKLIENAVIKRRYYPRGSYLYIQYWLPLENFVQEKNHVVNHRIGEPNANVLLTNYLTYYCTVQYLLILVIMIDLRVERGDYD